MKRKISSLLVLLLLVYVSPAYAQQRHALVIGIGQYEDPRWGGIHGDKDVDYVLQMLLENGFQDVYTLRNEEATKSAIVSAFDSLCRSCGRGDKVYVHFSGHGQQVTDTDGDEEDGWDEAWVPYDAQPYYTSSYRGDNHLIDDEINTHLARIKKNIGPSGRLVVVVDACHSGSATRAPGDSTLARGFDKKFEIPCAKPKRKSPAEEKWLTISACQSYQINWENAKPAVGKLTWCLYNLRKSLCSMSNDELKASITRIMQENPGPLEQTPAITGDINKESVKEVFN